MCHYKIGKEDKIAFVFSCPGRNEEIAQEPASGITGKNLEILLKILNTKLGDRLSFTRENITITNATENIEYKKKTGRTEATPNEVLDANNLKRLYDEIKHINDLIICSGKNADLAISQVLKMHPDVIANKVCISHLGMKSINGAIKKDINGTELKNGDAENTKKRLEVIASEIIGQIKTKS